MLSHIIRYILMKINIFPKSLIPYVEDTDIPYK